VVARGEAAGTTVGKEMSIAAAFAYALELISIRTDVSCPVVIAACKAEIAAASWAALHVSVKVMTTPVERRRLELEILLMWISLALMGRIRASACTKSTALTNDMLTLFSLRIMGSDWKPWQS